MDSWRRIAPIRYFGIFLMILIIIYEVFFKS